MITARLDQKEGNAKVVVIGLTQEDFDNISKEPGKFTGIALRDVGIGIDIDVIIIRGTNDADLKNQVMKFG